MNNQQLLAKDSKYIKKVTKFQIKVSQDMKIYRESSESL